LLTISLDVMIQRSWKDSEQIYLAFYQRQRVEATVMAHGHASHIDICLQYYAGNLTRDNPKWDMIFFLLGVSKFLLDMI
jgi:hypothetical protein